MLYHICTIVTKQVVEVVVGAVVDVMVDVVVVAVAHHQEANKAFKTFRERRLASRTKPTTTTTTMSFL
jgi:hypothetical protein